MRHIKHISVKKAVAQGISGLVPLLDSVFAFVLGVMDRKGKSASS